MKMIHTTCPGHPEATLEGYILDCEILYGQEKKRPAVLVCPGGGYLYCSPREAEPVALRYAANGFHAFILRYSVQWNAAGFSPLEEVSWAIGYIREHAEEWNIDADKIVACGFSAGGHLALASGLLAENKPNALILGYPATCAPNIKGGDFMLKLLEGKDQVTDADAAKYDLVAQVNKAAPPMFVAATADDMLTGFCTLPLVMKYTQLGLKCELHMFQHGPHGYAMADVTSADGSEQMVNTAYAQWHGLSVLWLRKIFGEPKLTDRSTSKMAGILKEMGMIPDRKQN